MVIMKMTGLEELDKTFEEIKKAPAKTLDKVTNAGVKLAVRNAPKKSGALIRSIRKGKMSKNVRIISMSATNPKTGFPYPFWVNVEQGYESVKLAGKKRTYASVRHTGVPGFFTNTAKALDKKFGKELSISIERAMK